MTPSMGNTQRRKASPKVIFFLHCTGLAQLFSYAIVGAYDFSRCNHSAIIMEYQNLLQKSMEEDQSKKIINCCPRMKSEGALLGCIHNFTQKFLAPQQSDIWNFTAALLAGNCEGYSESNGTQNVQVTFEATRKCRNQQERRTSGNRALQELNEMWRQYLYQANNKKITLSL